MITALFVQLDVLVAGVFDDITGAQILTFIAASGIFTAVGYAGKSWFERNVIRATARKEEASAADIVAGAAAELVNPLRLELKTTRDELAEVRAQLRKVTAEMHGLASQLETQQDRNEKLATRNEKLETRNTELERKNAECLEKLAHEEHEKK